MATRDEDEASLKAGTARSALSLPTQNLKKNLAQKFFSGQQVEARYRGSYRFSPATVLCMAGEGYDLRYNNGKVELCVLPVFIRESYSGAGTDCSPLDLKKSTEVSVTHLREISRDSWSPLVVSISGSSGMAALPGVLALGEAVTIVPISDTLKFYGDGCPSGKVHVTGKTVSFLFFIQPLDLISDETSQVCYGTVYCYSKAVLICKLEFQCSICEKEGVDSNKIVVKAPLFNSTFVVLEEDGRETAANASTDELLQHAFIGLGCTTVRRPDCNPALAKTLLLTSDHIQVVCSKASLFVTWAESSVT